MSVRTDSQFARRNGESFRILIVPGNASAEETSGEIGVWADSLHEEMVNRYAL